LQSGAPDASPLRSPITVLPITGSVLRDSPQTSLPLGTGCSQRPFAPPQRLLLSKPPFRAQRSWPATSLPARCFLCPFGLSAPLPSPVSPGGGGMQASGPLQSPQLARKPLLQPPLPLGTIASRRIKAFNWIRSFSVRLPNPPDHPSLPTAGFYL